MQKTIWRCRKQQHELEYIKRPEGQKPKVCKQWKEAQQNQ